MLVNDLIPSVRNLHWMSTHRNENQKPQDLALKFVININAAFLIGL